MSIDPGEHEVRAVPDVRHARPTAADAPTAASSAGTAVPTIAVVSAGVVAALASAILRGVRAGLVAPTRSAAG